MDFDDVMKRLEEAGSAQTRKVYLRHGDCDSLFGVKYADLNRLQRLIKVDHDLAMRLWDTGNLDARALAAKIFDPEAIDSKLLDRWAKLPKNVLLSGVVCEAVSRTPYVKVKMEKWTKSPKEWPGAIGWSMLSVLAQRDEELPDSYFEPYIDAIEERAHGSPNRVRYSMNGALIQIGLRSPKLEKKVAKVVARMGPIEVDHGVTSCKTPDVLESIAKAKARRQEKATREASRKKASHKKTSPKNTSKTRTTKTTKKAKKTARKKAATRKAPLRKKASRARTAS